MEKSMKVKLLSSKQPHKVKLRLLNNGRVIEMARRKFERNWDLGRYEVVNYEEAMPGVFNSELFEI